MAVTKGELMMFLAESKKMWTSAAIRKAGGRDGN